MDYVCQALVKLRESMKWRELLVGFHTIETYINYRKTGC